MDTIDNPDHGRRVFDGIRIVNHPFVVAKADIPPTPAPAGGPNFPAIEDTEINPVPS